MGIAAKSIVALGINDRAVSAPGATAWTNTAAEARTQMWWIRGNGLANGVAVFAMPGTSLTSQAVLTALRQGLDRLKASHGSVVPAD
jgi:hypothetical protein